MVDVVVIVSIPINIVGLGMIIWKIRKVKDRKVNKSYSKISIWMLYQLFAGMLFCIVTALAQVYRDEIVN